MDHLDGYPTDALTIDGMSTVDGMSTASTTHSLVRQMNSVSVDPAIMQRVAKQHNDNSAETIMSGTTGQLIPIPFAGNDYNDKDISGTTKQIKSWWGRYGFGVRFDYQIFCTVSRRQPNGCRHVLKSNGSSTSSFLLHLASTNSGHGLTITKRK